MLQLMQDGDPVARARLRAHVQKWRQRQMSVANIGLRLNIPFAVVAQLDREITTCLA
jgi:hypothetical protein